jgi:segregation and condensation protein B
MSSLKSQLESLLFVSNKPLKAKDLAKLLEVSEIDVKAALTELGQDRQDTGIVLLEASDGYQLATNSVNSPTIKNFLNADLREHLTDASIEVLAIVAYRQPISRAEIEAIRGVNSQYSLRALLIRGLIEKIPDPHDGRANLYQITTEFLQHLGLTSVDDLPDFNDLTSQVKLPETPGIKETGDSGHGSESPVD